jgi:hypothetical protein
MSGLRDARRTLLFKEIIMSQKKLNFHPRRHGYHFTNTFVNHVSPGIVTKGLCGGMAMSALDYWRARIAIPTHTASDFDVDGVPTDGSKMCTYIYNRQIDSLFTSLSVSRWIVFPWADTPENYHKWATQDEFEVVKKQIDMGRPALLGLWEMQHSFPPLGHQVLCYGYDTSTITLFLYDPNLPDQEATLRPVSPADGCEMRDESGNLYDKKHYRGYFFMDVYNWAENPPYKPEYNDLVILAGVRLTPSDSVKAGTSLDGSAIIKNVGDYPARFRSLNFWFRRPDAKDDLDVFYPFGTPAIGTNILKPGEERTLNGHCASFTDKPGIYRVGISADAAGQLSNPIPAGVVSGTTNPMKFKLHVRPETEVAPAAASLGHRVHVFNKGIDNRIYINSSAGNLPFSGWTEVQGHGETDRAVAAVSLGKRIHVFAKGIIDHRIYVNSALEGQGFDGWSEVQPQGFTTADAPAAASYNNHLYVFARGQDRGIYVNLA